MLDYQTTFLHQQQDGGAQRPYLQTSLPDTRIVSAFGVNSVWLVSKTSAALAFGKDSKKWRPPTLLDGRLKRVH